MSIDHPIAEASGTTTRTSLDAIVREIAAAGLSAAIAGVVAGGIGGRLAMRISAVLNPAMTGVRSENGNRIGDITIDGTFALVLFGGLLTGAVVAWTWVAIRTWLPERAPGRYVSAAVAAVGLTGFLVVDAGNFDFSLLDPGWLHVAMFIGIVAGAGWLTAWIDRRLVGWWPASTGFTVLAAVVVAQGALLTSAGLAVFFTGDFCGCETTPVATGVLLVVATIATIGAWVERRRGTALPHSIRLLGRAATAGAIGTGLVHLTGQIIRIV